VLVIPAIDLKDGRCVRLKQGDMATAKVFSEDPVAMAKHWAAQGARRLHIVDLNGAIAGRPKNDKVIRDMIAAVGDRVPIQLAKKFEEYGVESIIYTDIGRDGMMTGINIEATLKLAQALKTPIIASGGLNSLKDIEAVCAKLVPEGIIGAIAGRALYEGKIDLKAAQAAADKATGKA
jgi:phosphoribosylformimino-5-aminoimidazole carboxamide ribonucleotide (ProFAR) isomerase